MKRWVLASVAAIGVLLLGPAARSAAPELISYQGVLVQNDGIAVPDGVYDLRFGLFDQQAAGTLLFEQTLSAQVVHGLYNVILSSYGGYDLAAVVTGNTELFIEVTVLANPPAVPSDVTLLPRQQLASVPYALAQTSGLVSAATLRNSVETQVPESISTWTAFPQLEDLTLEVPSAGCLMSVEADVALGGDGTGWTLGVRIEESVDSGGYVPVRGPIVESGSGSEIELISLHHSFTAPTGGTYSYRVTLLEGNSAPKRYKLNPSGGIVGFPSESILSGRVWCP